eukprot:6212677-Pleurochrysis_carterae.AAC.2
MTYTALKRLHDDPDESPIKRARADVREESIYHYKTIEDTMLRLGNLKQRRMAGDGNCAYTTPSLPGARYLACAITAFATSPLISRSRSTLSIPTTSASTFYGVLCAAA